VATSVYFNKGHYKPEKTLYEEIIMEQIKAFGHDTYYVPRKLIKEDKLFGEDILSQFNTSYIVEMYVDNESVDSGEADALSKFGLVLSDEVKFQIAKRRWEEVISLDTNLISGSRPNEGDLIHCPEFSDTKVFEITYVDGDVSDRIGVMPVWTIGCKIFEYSHEALDTGITAIDVIEDTHSTDLLNLYDFLLEDSSGELVLENGDNITQEAYVLSGIDKTSVNEWIQVESDKIIDFTYTNPFGEP